MEFCVLLLLIFCSSSCAEESILKLGLEGKGAAINSYRQDINWSPEIEQEVINFVENAMTCRNVPGLSLAVVTSEEVLMQRGFGVADVEQNVPADENTVFCLASLTKAFVTTLMGNILAEYQSMYPLGWDTKLMDIMGFSFNLGDFYRSDQTTIRDILSHKVGFAQYNGFWLFGLEPEHPRSDYANRFQFLTPIAELRSKFIYNDWMYFLASIVMEEITGQTFEQLVRDRIFLPLQMQSSIFPDDIIDWNQVASAYFLNVSSGTIQQLDPELLRTRSPAESTGGICSTAVDVSRWLQWQLQEYHSLLLPELYWQETHEGQFYDKPAYHYKPLYPVSEDHSVYGLGWWIGSYRGYRASQHVGSLAGFESKIVIHHDMNLAVFVNTNGPIYEQDVNNVITYHIADLVLGKETWLNHTTACTYPEPWTPQFPSQKQDQQTPHNIHNDVQQDTDEDWINIPTEYEKYIGTYGHLLFGNMTVYFDENSQMLRFNAGRLGQGELVHRENDWFDLHYDGPLSYYHWTGVYSEFEPVIHFQNIIGNVTWEISANAYDENSASLLIRGLDWDDIIIAGAKGLAISYGVFVLAGIITLIMTW